MTQSYPDFDLLECKLAISSCYLFLGRALLDAKKAIEIDLGLGARLGRTAASLRRHGCPPALGLKPRILYVAGQTRTHHGSGTTGQLDCYLMMLA